jgi:sugar phosphate isomerase/epimerase
VKVGLFTDGLVGRSLDETLDWLEEHAPEISDLELGTGGYSPAPHCPAEALAGDEKAVAELGSLIGGRGFRLAALNVSGNPLHPDRALAQRADGALRATLRLAAALGVERVVAMSGCPGSGPDVRHAPHFVGGGWLPDLEGILEWQWQKRVLPYWRGLSVEAADVAPDVRICFELHPGTCVYNLTTFDWIAEAGDNLAVNLDPSHLMWQTMDPITVVERLGPRIGFAHGKDTRTIDDNLAVNGLLDCRWPGRAAEMPWNFATVGRGHDLDWWRRFADALRSAGYDGVISIEYEDPFLSPEESILEAVAVLDAALREAESVDR